ncbi:MAG: hypothetical protein WBD31_25465 [Rubripirellula sp.]
MSGCGSRDDVMAGVRDRIFVRAMAIGNDDKLCMMVSIEGIAVTAEQTKRLLAAIDENHSSMTVRPIDECACWSRGMKTKNSAAPMRIPNHATSTKRLLHTATRWLRPLNRCKASARRWRI